MDHANKIAELAGPTAPARHWLAVITPASFPRNRGGTGLVEDTMMAVINYMHEGKRGQREEGGETGEQQTGR